MSTVIIEHVKVSDLPETWRARLTTPAAEHVTVRIEEEAAATQPVIKSSDAAMDLMFGMWRDRKDMTDVGAYIRQLRAPRYNLDGSRNTD